MEIQSTVRDVSGIRNSCWELTKTRQCLKTFMNYAGQLNELVLKPFLA